MSLQETIGLFDQVNIECWKSGGIVVPFSAQLSTMQHYATQMENLEFSTKDIIGFQAYLSTKPFRTKLLEFRLKRGGQELQDIEVPGDLTIEEAEELICKLCDTTMDVICELTFDELSE